MTLRYGNPIQGEGLTPNYTCPSSPGKHCVLALNGSPLEQHHHQQYKRSPPNPLCHSGVRLFNEFQGSSINESPVMFNSQHHKWGWMQGTVEVTGRLMCYVRTILNDITRTITSISLGQLVQELSSSSSSSLLAHYQHTERERGGLTE